MMMMMMMMMSACLDICRTATGKRIGMVFSPSTSWIHHHHFSPLNDSVAFPAAPRARFGEKKRERREKEPRQREKGAEERAERITKEKEKYDGRNKGRRGKKHKTRQNQMQMKGEEDDQNFEGKSRDLIIVDQIFSSPLYSSRRWRDGI